jgi:hypothetical protein
MTPVSSLSICLVPPMSESIGNITHIEPLQQYSQSTQRRYHYTHLVLHVGGASSSLSSRPRGGCRRVLRRGGQTEVRRVANIIEISDRVSPFQMGLNGSIRVRRVRSIPVAPLRTSAPGRPPIHRRLRRPVAQRHFCGWSWILTSAAGGMEVP